MNGSILGQHLSSYEFVSADRFLFKLLALDRFAEREPRCILDDVFVAFGVVSGFRRAIELLRFYGTAGHDAFPVSGLTPFAVNVRHVRAQTTNGNFQKALAFGGFKQDAFLFGEPMSNRSAADTCFGR